MKDKVILRANNILLREIEDTDLPYVFNGLSNPKVIQYYGVSFETLEATKTQMEWFASPKQQWFAICSLDNTIFYGAGGLSDISLETKKAEIGLWLLPEYWGKGIMITAMPLICSYGFNELGLQCIEGFVDTENENCKRAMAKLDFEFEGTVTEFEIKKDKYVSIDIYSKKNTNTILATDPSKLSTN